MDSFDDHEKENINKSKRSAKTNSKQYEKIKHFMEENDEKTTGRASYNDLWIQLCEELNVLGPPEHSPGDWKKVWSKYKYLNKTKTLTEVDQPVYRDASFQPPSNNIVFQDVIPDDFDSNNIFQSDDHALQSSSSIIVVQSVSEADYRSEVLNRKSGMGSVHSTDLSGDEVNEVEPIENDEHGERNEETIINGTDLAVVENGLGEGGDNAEMNIEVTEVRKGRPKRGRKRRIAEQSRSDRKRLYNNNETHYNSKGDIVYQKIFDDTFVCPCRKKCTNSVSVELRKRLFNQFWNMGSFAGRCTLLVTCVSKKDTRNVYSIFGNQVCKLGLIRTLQINEGRLTIAMKKMNGDSYADQRGKFSGGRNAFPPEKRDEVRSHISSFPKYVSHYTRNKNESKYLNTNLCLEEMYRLYIDKFAFPVSKSVYKRIFYDDFNLRFKAPKKDTCKKCDKFKAKVISAVGTKRESLEKSHESHLKQADLLQSLMKADLENAKTDPELETLTYDMQKTLALPRMPTNIVYYLRQLNFYNCGIHVGSSGKGMFHVWPEYIASKGTQEVGSCLKSVINNITAPTKKLILWSDSCGGQNRSIKLVLMLIHVLQNHPTLEMISLRYLESGHTFLPNDSEFGDFECCLKRNTEVYTDSAYIEIMEKCRTKNKFVVNKMLPGDFFSVKQLENAITNRKVDVNKQKVNWLLTHEILLDKLHPNILKMKRKIGDDFQTVNIGKTATRTDLKSFELEQLWPNGRPISKEKLDDLTKMMDLIASEYKHFYSFIGVVMTHEFEEDVDGFAEELDFDLEDEDEEQ